MNYVWPVSANLRSNQQIEAQNINDNEYFSEKVEDITSVARTSHEKKNVRRKDPRQVSLKMLTTVYNRIKQQRLQLVWAMTMRHHGM